MDEREKKLDEALKQIERNFPNRTMNKEEFVDRMIAKGTACAMCRKLAGSCSCDCDCKGCWGKMSLKYQNPRQ